MTLRFAHVLDDPAWLAVPPWRIGAVPKGLGTPARYLLLDAAPCPLRVDLYAGSDESHHVEAAAVWGRFLVVGWGASVYLIDRATRGPTRLELGSYFNQLHAAGDLLLVASAEHLFRIAIDGSVAWCSEPLGIDGVVVHGVDAGVVIGDGEWDPPGGWRAFRVDAATGRRAG